MKPFKLLFLSILVLTIISCNNKSSKKQNQISDKNERTMLTKNIESYISDIENEFGTISETRKKKLSTIADYIRHLSEKNQAVNLTFICTHNSRRSHLSQIWAQAAAYKKGLKNVHCFSGGTESTAFNPRAVKALSKAGFHIDKTDTSSNPVYEVQYADNVKKIKAFSKKYSDKPNPSENFAAIMTCSHADANCPFIPGTDKRFAIPYEDPKVADNTPGEEAKYDERCKQIAIEMFYLFSLV